MKRSAYLLFGLGVLFAAIGYACSQNGDTVTATATNQKLTLIPSVVTPTRVVTTSNFVCWPIDKNTNEIKGSLIFQDFDSKHVFAWDVSSFHTELIKGLPEELLRPSSKYYIVSPDGNTIVGLAPPKLIVITRNQLKTFLLPENEYDLPIEYLGNGKIRIPISRDSLMDGYTEGIGFTDKFYIFDPNTGDFLAQSVFLPDFFVERRGVFAIKYSSNMNYAVYLTSFSKQGPQYILYDLNNKEIIWNGLKPPLNMSLDPDRMPIWKPNSNELTYSFIANSSGNAEYGNYYHISLAGESTELTHFSQTEVMGQEGGWLANPIWSSDGRYLAFRAAQEAPGSMKLYIWDDKEKVALTPCLPDENQVDQGYSGYWSFDSQYFFITLGYPNKDTQEGAPPFVRTNTVILDLVNKNIIELPEQDQRGKEFTSLYGNGGKIFLGWVNWEIP